MAERTAGVPLNIVRVLPEEAAINKTFDYEVPPSMSGAELVRIGTEVRIELHGRRTGGWVVATDVEPLPGVTIKPLSKIRGIGPPASVVDIATWAAWRWGGRPAQVLRFAAPPLAVRHLPARPARTVNAQVAATDPLVRLLQPHLTVDSSGVHVVQTPPGLDRSSLILACTNFGGAAGALIVTASLTLAANLERRLRRGGISTALLPHDWAAAATGGRVVIGARNAAFAPIDRPGIILVVDEHDEAHQDERTPTWHARDVAIERARRLGIPCVLTSAHPTPEAIAAASFVHRLDRSTERAAWPRVDIIDRSIEEPGRHRLISPRLVESLRTDERVVCILNRTGRARMMACASCGDVASCEKCEAAVHQLTDAKILLCPRCEAQRPVVCRSCGGATMKNLRLGTSRAREELEALALRPVGEVSGEVTAEHSSALDCAVLVGTEALLHRVDRASTVMFLDADGDLLAPRLRAAEHTMSMFSRAARLLVARRSGSAGRLIVQTRQPRHPAFIALALGDPTRLTDHDTEVRGRIGMQPGVGLARITGAASHLWAERLRGDMSVQVGGSADDGFIIRAVNQPVLADALARVDEDRPPGRVRVEVDPLRL